MNMRSVKAAVVAVAASLILAGSASAATIALNVPTSSFDIPSLIPVVTSRFRFDVGGGVDQMLFKQAGGPAGYPAADLIRMNPNGGGQYFGTATYNFQLQHTAATRKFEFSLTNGTVTAAASFANGTSANNTLNYIPAVGELDYNILHVYARSSNGATVSVSNMAFVAGSGLTATGALNAAASVTSGTYDQWLYSPVGTNLDLFDWTFSAVVTLQQNGTLANSEALKFEFTGKNGAVVPEPSGLAIVAASGMLLGRRRRA